jgi:hypothetical protein
MRLSQSSQTPIVAAINGAGCITILPSRALKSVAAPQAARSSWWIRHGSASPARQDLRSPFGSGNEARRLLIGIDIGPDDDEVLGAVFLQPQSLSLAPTRLIICQHEIPMLDDVEHLDNLSLNPISAAIHRVKADRTSGNRSDFWFCITGAGRRQWTGPLPSHAAATPNRAVLMAADDAASA